MPEIGQNSPYFYDHGLPCYTHGVKNGPNNVENNGENNRSTDEKTPLFASLDYPGTRRYFAGLVLSMTGTWMQSIAMAWLVVKKLGGGGHELGLLQVFQFAPILVLGAWAGSLADRVDKRKFMAGTQVILGLGALLLATLDFSDRASMGAVFAISGVTGLANAFDTPIRRALIGDLVPKSSMPNAMSLNTGVITSARVLGMALGGFVTKFAGTQWCFLLNGISYLAMMAALWGLQTRAHTSAPAASDSGVREAALHLWRTPALRVSMLATSLIATLTFNYGLTFPLLVEGVFKRDADGLGLLMMLTSVGSFVGALVSAKRTRPTVEVFLTGALIMGAGCLGVASAPSFAISNVYVVPMGFGGGLLMAQLSGMLTSLSPSSMRGRVLALQSVIFLGSTPIGGPIIGTVSDQWGARWGVAIGGIAAIAATAISYRPTQKARRNRQAVTSSPHQVP